MIKDNQIEVRLLNDVFNGYEVSYPICVLGHQDENGIYESIKITPTIS